MTPISSKTRILFLNENPLPPIFVKGTISAKELRLRSAIKQIDEVHVIARPGHPIQSHQKFQTSLEEKIIVHLTIPWPYYLSSLILFIYGLYYCLKLKPVTIEAESPIYSGLAAIILGRLFNIPSLVEVRTTFASMLPHRLSFIPISIKRFVLNLVQPFVLTNADQIIVNSFAYQQALSSQNLASVVINPGLQYPPTTSPKNTLPNSPITIGYLGRLVSEKGINKFITAVKLLSDHHDTPPFRVEIAGQGPQKNQLKKLVSSLNITHLITFLGQVENYTVLSHWDILVNPCLVNAPLEMVNVEAAYMGIPVICFGNQRIPETVIDGKTGLKSNTKSAQTLYLNILKLMQDSKLYSHLSQAGRPFAVKHYSFESQVNELSKLYKNLSVI